LLLKHCDYLLIAWIKVMLCIWRLSFKSHIAGTELLCLPIYTTVDFVECYDEWSFAVAQQLQTFNCLVFKSMHKVNNENGKITQSGATRTQIGERLVPWSIDYKKSWCTQFAGIVCLTLSDLLYDFLCWKVGGSNLLSDTSSFSLLNISVAQLVK
jgi:hypothetical protein